MPKATRAASVAMATAVAGLFAVGVGALLPEPSKEEAKVQCAGIDTCNGEAGCATAANGCQGPNGCSGVQELSREECERRGGTVVTS